MIQHYHAHIYFEPQQIEFAQDLRQKIAGKFAVVTGRLHAQPVGPHPKPMFQVLFTHDLFASFVPWLQQARAELDVLIHADSGNDLADHTQYAMWLGNSQPLDLSRLH